MESNVITNGYLSENIKIARGLPQGSPLSPFLFVLGLEIFAQHVRENNNIIGLKYTQNKEKKINLLADDTMIGVEAKGDSLMHVVEALHTFEKLSGLKMNEQKSLIVKIGLKRNTEYEIRGAGKIKILAGHFKYLGIKMSHNVKEIMSLNFDNTVAHFKGVAARWKRHLTEVGKVLVISD